MKLYAIIGATASGKSKLAFSVAQHFRHIPIFSLDSLCVYQSIDIASAKPSKNELQAIKHYGIDVLTPEQSCHVGIFINTLKQALDECMKQNIHSMLLVGGSSFYLKSIIDGVSAPPPPLTHQQKQKLQHILSDLLNAYNLLCKIDYDYAQKIKKNDYYRLQKAFEIYLSTSLTPTAYFKQHPRISPIKENITLFELYIDAQILQHNIITRTSSMIQNGLIEEAKELIKNYNRHIQPFKSIGLKETLMHLDNHISKQELENQIIIHTRQFAKRQRTFNKTQFNNIQRLSYNSLYNQLIQALQKDFY